MHGNAVKIGDLMLYSSKPITEAEKKEAAMLAHKNARILPTADGEVALSTDPELLKR
jgi:hypothetical protein